jgi:cerevisin
MDRPQPASAQYMVKLKKGVVMTDHIKDFSNTDPHGHVVTRTWNPNFLNAYAGTFSAEAVELLKQNPNVEYVVKNTEDTTCMIATQNTAPWGLAQINQAGALRERDTTYNYAYDMTNETGLGVDVYILDTGIFTAHSDFGGRARWGITFIGTDGQDVDGHGTHVGGTIGGARWGVAKGANLIAVKVLGDDGRGSKMDSIDGLQWVRDQALASGRPSVVNMSLGGQKNQLQNDAVDAVTAAGIHVVVAAGNDEKDAKDTSPASAPSAITVGACDINGRKWRFSNFGSVVDFFAPGSHVISCATGDENFNWGINAYTEKSGTSMATPHVTGITATILSMKGNMPTKAMTETIKALSIKDKLQDIPKGTANAFARGCVHTPARFRLESNWAKVATVAPCRAIFSEIDSAVAKEYYNITSTIQMLQCGHDNVDTYFDRTIMFMKVSANLRIGIAIFPGTDKAKRGDKTGRGIADFAGHTYENAHITGNGHNAKVFKDCPTTEEVTRVMSTY